MNTSVLIHGPQGCGKTRHKQQLMKHFGLERCMDDVYFRNLTWLKVQATERPTLFLTAETPPDSLKRQLRHIRVMTYADAAKQAQLPTAASHHSQGAR